MKDYKIDLVTVELTTRKFFLLLNNLSDDSPLQALIRLRTTKISNKRTKSIDEVIRRNRIKRAQQQFNLTRLLFEEDKMIKNVSRETS